MKKNIHYTTHEFLTSHLPGISQEDIILLSRKTQEIRKIQDRYCYIHAKINDSKIFSKIQHLKIERSIQNKLKLFNIEFIEMKLEENILDLMITEAVYQKELFRYLNATSIVIKRRNQINFFLNYCYSRSLELYNQEIKGKSHA